MTLAEGVSDESEGVVYDNRFRDLFGVTKDDLIAKGINPDVYIRENLRRALRSSPSSVRFLSDHTRLRLRFFVYAKWFNVFAFFTLIFLLLTGLHVLSGVKTALFVFCYATALAMIICGIMQISCAKRYRHACKREGIKPHIYGSRRRI